MQAQGAICMAMGVTAARGGMVGMKGHICQEQTQGRLCTSHNRHAGMLESVPYGGLKQRLTSGYTSFGMISEGSSSGREEGRVA